MFFPSFGGGGSSGAQRGSAAPSLTPSADVSQNQPNDSISGKFDPTALERGAKALRDLDASPNAARAFEVTKLQELTRQKELEKEMEQIQSARFQMQAERARIEGDERRKTATHQQEQERVTAQYKAQLEAEAYAKKLQDQQQQNERCLEQQHQQFLRQEQLRKENERQLLEMKREQIREEKKLERELIKMKVHEETKGRIQQERENVDVHLRELRARAAEERKTKLDVIQATLSTFGGACNSLLEDKAKLTTTVAGITALAVGIYGARSGTAVAGRYIESRLGKPPLVRETSRWNITQGWKYALFPWLRRPNTLSERIVLPPELSERLQWTANSLTTARKHGTPFRHLLLYGNPGTGKTLFARTLARESGLDYAVMAGGDIGPLGRDAVTEINRLFQWANKSRKGLILFIDEAEAFLRQGRGAQAGSTISEETRNVLSTFLHHTGTESDKFCVILATNVKEVLDKAVLDRVDEQFEFPLPGEQERLRMLEMFFTEYITTPTKKGKTITVDPEINSDFLQAVARRTEGFSGRQLAKLILGMQAAVFGSGTNTLTKGLAETVLQWKLAHLEEDSETLERQHRATELARAEKEKRANPLMSY